MAVVKLALLCVAATRAFLRPAPGLARRPAPLRAAADVASRVVAFRVLEAARAREAPVDELLRRHGASLGERDLAFAKRLVDTAQRRAGDIDAEIDAACRRRPRGATLAALRLGVAQLLFCDGVPSRAAVHSSVEVCKAFRGSPGLVNGVLRGIDRRRGAAPAAAGAVAAAPWLREALERDHGAEVAARYLAAAAQAPERLDVTCATAGDRDAFVAAVAALDGANVAARRGALGAGVRTAARTRVADLPLYDAGVWWVQDAAAAAAAAALDAALPRRSRVLDACAAPGGKTLQLAARGHRVVAVDKSPRRAERLRANLARCAVGDVAVDVGDAAARCAAAAAAGELFDGVLLDAPCSATGTARRRPDVLAKPPDDVPGLVATTAALFAACWAALKPGGVLVFASCSALRAEAEDAVAALAPPDAEPLPLRARDVDDDFADAAFVGGHLRLWPWHLEGGACDAHFVARFRKAG